MIHSKPYLEKYKGRKSRHECPSCHDKHSFTYYLDGDSGAIIDKQVGRCDHESSCGYHYTPKQYFEDNPDKKQEGFEKGRERVKHKPVEPRKAPVKVNKIPKEYLIQSLGYNSNFVAFLCGIFDQDTLESPTIESIMREYYLGQTADGGVIFWQVGIDKRIRTGKVMQYDRHTGKRIRMGNGAIDWVHARLKKKGVLPRDFELEQCCFGEHLLGRYPDKVVALVESEKSAIIACGMYPDFIWLSTGGKSQLSPDKMRVLKSRTVVMFPDADGYELWTEKAKELEELGCTVMVSDLIESNASAEDKAAKIDIADWLIRDLKRPVERVSDMPINSEEKALQHLGSINPNVYRLIGELDLVSTKTNQPI